MIDIQTPTPQKSHETGFFLKFCAAAKMGDASLAQAIEKARNEHPVVRPEPFVTLTALRLQRVFAS